MSKRYLTLQPTPIQRVVTLETIPLKLSEDQVAKLNAAAAKLPGAKKPDPAGKAPQHMPSSRTIIATAPRAGPSPATAVAAHAVAPAAVDGVGLILARAERHE